MAPKIGGADKRKTRENAPFVTFNAPRELSSRRFGYLWRESAFPRRREPSFFRKYVSRALQTPSCALNWPYFRRVKLPQREGRHFLPA